MSCAACARRREVLRRWWDTLMLAWKGMVR